MGAGGQRVSVSPSLSLHTRDLVPVVRERIQKNHQLRVCDGSRAYFRGHFVVVPSENVTNSCRAGGECPAWRFFAGSGRLAIQPGTFLLPGNLTLCFPKYPKSPGLGCVISAGEFIGRKSGAVVDRPYGLLGALPGT